MNDAFAIWKSSSTLPTPNFRYVILVSSVPLYGFDCLESAKRVLDTILDFNPLVVVSLVVNSNNGDDKETSDV